MGRPSDSLGSFLDAVCTDSHLRVETDLGDGFVRLRSDEAERRQAAHDIRSSEDVVIELLRNARDAGARNIYLATATSGSLRRIVVVDDGEGIPEPYRELVFEPRVTSKLDTVHMDKWGVHGRGMALYSVSVNARRACVASSDPGKGTSVLVETDTSSLKEKSDQSTFPTVTLAEQGRAVIRGPHNIARCAVEFALEHRKTVSVYFGSIAEVASAMYWRGTSLIPASTRSFAVNFDAAPLPNRLCFATDDEHLAEICAGLGLEMSPRTARRIMDREIEPAPPVAEVVEQSLAAGLAQGDAPRPEAPAKPKRTSSGKGEAPRVSPRFDDASLSSLRADVGRAYRAIAEAYYLDPDVPVDVRVANGSLRLSIPLVDLE